MHTQEGRGRTSLVQKARHILTGNVVLRDLRRSISPMRNLVVRVVGKSFI